MILCLISVNTLFRFRGAACTQICLEQDGEGVEVWGFSSESTKDVFVWPSLLSLNIFFAFLVSELFWTGTNSPCSCSARHSSGLWVVLLHLCKWLKKKNQISPPFPSKLLVNLLVLWSFYNCISYKMTATISQPVPRLKTGWFCPVRVNIWV